MTFLDPNYKVPTTSNYMKLQEGANRFRVLSSAITGYEVWVTENIDGKPVNKPVRQKDPFQTLPQNVKVNDYNEPEKQKHFWAFVVFNYQDEKIQILELTQTGVQKAIKAIVSDEDWGDPKAFDIVVTGEGKGKDRRYQTTPKPHKPLDLTDDQANFAASINLEALYEGKDPFQKDEVNIKDINL
jgi:hypothetical protein